MPRSGWQIFGTCLDRAILTDNLFHTSVLGWFSRLNVHRIDAPLDGPGQEVSRGELRAVSRLPHSSRVQVPSQTKGVQGRATDLYVDLIYRVPLLLLPGHGYCA